jgi:hypothetical protein
MAFVMSNANPDRHRADIGRHRSHAKLVLLRIVRDPELVID